MSGIRVLNTRPREQALELAQRLRDVGLESVEAPAIEVVSTWTPAELHQVRRDVGLGRFDWAVIPSQNAGRELVDVLGSTQVVCGVATAAALRLHATVALERFSARATLEALRPRVRRGQHVLLPRAAKGRTELLDGLRALGALVTAPIAYRTEQVSAAAQRLSAGGIDVVTVCSPSAVESLLIFGDVSLLRQTTLVCLGETTAATAAAAGLHVAAVAPSTSMAALVGAIQAVIARPEVPA